MMDQAMTAFEQFLQDQTPQYDPVSLFDPITYTLEVPGKRLRPYFALLAYRMFGGSKVEQDAFPVAAALEIFHNFTLLHDDLMDASDRRRKRATVWKKWNANAAILSGDAMLVLAYQVLNKSGYEPRQELFATFSQVAMEVCMGQQYDMDFESRSDVTVDEYMEMIRLKTSVLLGGALKLGAMVADASAENQDLLYRVGETMGLAFQLQDDYLDTFGDEAIFGKPTGGDIREGKKTWLMIKAIEEANRRSEGELFKRYSQLDDPEERVDKVKSKYLSYGLDEKARELITNLSQQAVALIGQMTPFNADSAEAQELKSKIESLAERVH